MVEVEEMAGACALVCSLTPTCPKDSGEPHRLLRPNLDLSVSDK